MRTPSLTGWFLPLALACSPAVHAVEITGMKDFPNLHGRYAPGGDCQRQPRIAVDASGMVFELEGRSERAARLEYAASYGGNFYEGSSQWFFPFGREGAYPVLMTFNADEKPGVLSLTPHDEGYAGGPPLSPRNRALVAGSPYLRCR
ncbi:hypothetical protein LAG73_06850 [Pseudoxanthomonas japonensis]|nr:hypothetical protein LAG73_06850 [Pseudoxanthomonas japonensis]